MGLALNEALREWKEGVLRSLSYQRLLSGEEERYWEEHAEQYRRNRTNGPHFTAVAEWLRQRVPFKAGLIELGPGPAVFTPFLAEHCRQVTVIEPSKALVRFLGRHCAGFPNVRVVPATFEECEVAPHDVVFAAGVLHLFPDLAGCLGKMLRLAQDKVLIVLLEEATDWADEVAAFLGRPTPPPLTPPLDIFFKVFERLVPSYTCKRLQEEHHYHYASLRSFVDLWPYPEGIPDEASDQVLAFLATRFGVTVHQNQITVPRHFISYLIEVNSRVSAPAGSQSSTEVKIHEMHP